MVRITALLVFVLTLVHSSHFAWAEITKPDDAEVMRLKEKIERLEAENEALKDQLVKLRRESAERSSPRTTSLPAKNVLDKLSVTEEKLIGTWKAVESELDEPLSIIFERDTDGIFKSHLILMLFDKPTKAGGVFSKKDNILYYYASAQSFVLDKPSIVVTVKSITSTEIMAEMVNMNHDGRKTMLKLKKQ